MSESSPTRILRTTVVADGPKAARVEMTIANASALEEATESILLSVHHAMVLHSPGPPQTTPKQLAVPKIGPNILAAMAHEDDDKRRVLDVIELRELLIDFQQLSEALIDFNDVLKNAPTSHEKYRSPIERRRPPRKERLEALSRKQATPRPPSPD